MISPVHGLKFTQDNGGMKMNFEIIVYAIKGFTRAMLEGFCANIVLPLTYLYIKLKEAVNNIAD